LVIWGFDICCIEETRFSNEDTFDVNYQ